MKDESVRIDWAKRWHGLFGLLSMNYLVPFWKDMGLHIHAAHQEIVRDSAQIAYLTIQGGELGHFAANYDTDSVQTAIVRFQESLNAVSPDLARAVMEWCEHYYVATASVSALETTWWGALVDLKSQYPSLKHSLLLSEKTLASLVEAIHRDLIAPYNDLEARFKKVTIAALSDWDRRMYQGMKIDDNEGETEAPYASIAEMQIVCWQLRQFWRELRSILNQSEIHQLFDWYQRQCAHIVRAYPHLRRIPE